MMVKLGDRDSSEYDLGAAVVLKIGSLSFR